MDQIENIYLTKHRQIIEAINAEIQENHLKPYDRLPSEKELCEQWQASRSTVRKAMDQLTDRGKIFRVPGKGSFVSFPKISHQATQVLSFTEKMKAQGLDVETKLILKEIIEPDTGLKTLVFGEGLIVCAFNSNNLLNGVARVKHVNSGV